MGLGDQRHAPASLSPGKRPLPFVQEDGWATGSFWTNAKNLALSGFRTHSTVVSSEYNNNNNNNNAFIMEIISNNKSK